MVTSARCADLLAEVRRREKALGVEHDAAVDAMMQTSAVQGAPSRYPSSSSSYHPDVFPAARTWPRQSPASHTLHRWKCSPDHWAVLSCPSDQAVGCGSCRLQARMQQHACARGRPADVSAWSIFLDLPVAMRRGGEFLLCAESPLPVCRIVS